jgi:hypothetical protein
MSRLPHQIQLISLADSVSFTKGSRKKLYSLITSLLRNSSRTMQWIENDVLFSVMTIESLNYMTKSLRTGRLSGDRYVRRKVREQDNGFETHATAIRYIHVMRSIHLIPSRKKQNTAQN